MTITMPTRISPTLALLGLLVVACGTDSDANESAETPETPPAMAEAEVSQDLPGCFLRGATTAEAAGRASPLDSATVSLAAGEAKICYGAPSANERVVMGELVPYGAPWRTGANEATALHLTFPAEVAGVRLDPGSYSLYTIPNEASWEVVLNRGVERWGIPINDEVRGADIGSGMVTPEPMDDMVERLTLRFDRMNDREAHLIMEWEHTRLRIPVAHAGG